MSKKPPNSNAQLELILHKLDGLEDMVKEHKVALVGKDGLPGLVGNFNVLCQRVSSLELIMSNDIKHLQASLDVQLRSRDLLENARYQSKEIVDKAKEDNLVTWSSVLKDWIKPVITAIVTSLLWWVATRGL